MFRIITIDDAARQALDWGLMELQEFLEDEELALGVKGEGPGMQFPFVPSFVLFSSLSLSLSPFISQPSFDF